MESRQQEQRDQAFTIIEILIVIGVIGILAGLLMPALAGARKRAKVSVCHSIIRELQTAIQQYNTDTGRYPLDAVDSAGAKPANTVLPPSALWGSFPYSGPAIGNGFCWTLVESFEGDGYEDGPTAPYFEFKPDNFYPEQATTTLMDPLATPTAKDPEFLDPWGEPYRYRQNFSLGYKPDAGNPSYFIRGYNGIAYKGPWFHICNRLTYDLWSPGPDGKDYDSSVIGLENDDVTNWD